MENQFTRSRLIFMLKVTRPFGFKIAGDINCDTRESVSIVNRVASLNLTQKVAG